MKFAPNLARTAALGLPLALMLGVSACNKSPSAQQQDAPDTVSGPTAKPGMTLSEGALMLPIVDGRPGAVYFTLANNSSNPVSLVSAYVEGAGKAEMHETVGNSMKPRDKVDLTPGETLRFAPGGLHVMVFGLTPGLKAGGTTELTLTFADGDKISAPLAIKKMGSDPASDMGDDDMAGMQH